jgi:hypothetical protein
MLLAIGSKFGPYEILAFDPLRKSRFQELVASAK